MTAAEALGAALVAEHAAIYGYGVVGAHLDKAGQEAARLAEAAHRSRRDALTVRLTEGSSMPPAAEPAYTLPFAVSDRAGALRLAVALEEAAAEAWRRALPQTTADDRRLAVQALVGCAVQATRWRRTAGVSPATVPFPGSPG
jgi:hypothetical protein